MARQDTGDATSPTRLDGAGPGTENYLAHSASNLSIPHPPESGKRRLLLIYVHGFNGSEASFHAFPAHVHSLLTDALAESHEVYTRIYPRYKSRGDMKIARDQFSSWLSPHEANDLDIILLGHSLGGILTADVALLPSSPLHPHQTRKHNILGLINFDVPFLGLHPGIIQTSCKSLFHRDRDRDPSPAKHETETFSETETETQITAEAIAAFSPSHYDPPFFNDVRWAERSGMQGVVHFFEKNYNRLAKSILTRIVSPYEFAGCLNNYPTLRRRYKQLMDMEAEHDQASRIRFVNYYTASEAPAPLKDKDNAGESEHSPHASMEHSSSPVDAKETSSCTEEKSENEPEPEPEPCSLTPTTSHPESEVRPEPERDPDPDQSDCTSETVECTSKQHKEKKRRKFVLLPSHHWSHGDDSLWIPVNMDNMNEITAHQSLFLPHGRSYDQLVGDTMATIEQWIQVDLTQRMLAQEEQERGSDVYKES